MTAPNAIGGAPSYVDALLNQTSAHYWNNGNFGQAVTVTYNFPNWYDAGDGGPAYYFSSAQMTYARQAIALWSDVANVNFVEVSASSTSNIEIRKEFQPAGVAGGTYYPNTVISVGGYYYNVGGSIYLDPSYSPAAPGTYNFEVIAHELGHALGLKHPGNYNAGGGGTEGPYLPSSTDNRRYTIMSYYNAPGLTSINPLTPMLYDVAALQYAYGARQSHLGNDTYTFSTSTQMKTIWDAGGSDTFDASNQTSSVWINLQPGTFSSIGTGGSKLDNIAIAYNCTIENAIGGSANDTIVGNDVNNQITGKAGNDTENGLRGVDTAVFSGNRSAYTLTALINGVHVSGPDGTDTINHIERLRFSDQTVRAPTISTTSKEADFDGDHRSDLLWQASNGRVANWMMYGDSQSSGSTVGTNPGPEWRVRDSGDFNNDGYQDLLFQNTSGLACNWLVKGSRVVGGGTIGSNPGSEWSVKAAGDTNGDGKADILWQRSDGLAATWLLNGSRVVGSSIIGSNPGSEWHLRASADFNGDGKADILWQRSDGQTATWLLNGSRVGGAGILGGNPGSEWKLRAAGDINGDGKADLIWQRATDGLVGVWYVSGAHVGGAAIIASAPGPDWVVKSAGDYNGDGKGDLAVQRNDGTPAIWVLNGTRTVEASAGPSPGNNWHLVAGVN